MCRWQVYIDILNNNLGDNLFCEDRCGAFCGLIPFTLCLAS